MTETWVSEDPDGVDDEGEVPPGGIHRVVKLPSGVVVRNNPPNATGSAPDQWVPAGPSVALHGQATGRPRVTGRVRALAVSDDGRRIYAGSALGGVWYSSDGGKRWLALDFYASTKDLSGDLGNSDALAVGAVAVRWGTTAAADVVFVGTGERPPAGYDRTVQRVQGVGVRVATGPVMAVTAGGPAADPWTLEATNLSGTAISRLAFDRANPDVVWAATSRGLYRRPTSGRDEWDHVDAGLGNGWVTDVMVLPGSAGEAQRIYAASAAGKVVRSTDGTHWQEMPLPRFPAAQVAADIPVERIALATGNTPGRAVVFALGGGPRLWRIDGDTAEIVTGLPRDLFGRQTAYDMAIAVHPAADLAHRDLLVVGGKSFAAPNGPPEAALFRGSLVRVGGVLSFSKATVPAGQPPAEWIGEGVHADVHALVWVGNTAPAQLWVGCDGGVFRSMNDGYRGTFQSRNTGLPVIQATTLAQHPWSAGLVLLGTQDNGVIRRIGAETWRLGKGGDGGGVAIDGADARIMYGQDKRSAWYRSTNSGATFAKLDFLSSPATTRPPADQQRWTDARNAEEKASQYYSQMALVTSADTVRGTQVALGTDRVWYVDDDLLRRKAGGRTGWVTLPSATDPYDPTRVGPDRAQDALNGPVLMLRWGTPDRLYALTTKSVYLIERVAGAWTATQQLYDQDAVHRNWKGKVPSGQIPDNTPPIELAVHDPAAGKGSLYVGTTGPDDEQHLWWYDGAGAWKPAGLKVASPVHAVVVDPQHGEVVYAGTDVGVFKGVGNFPPGDDPSWTWTLYSDGLPEASCVDLLLHSPVDGGPRLLRAALAGRGVWELALDGVLQGPEVYLRAHALDTRRGTLPTGGPRDVLRPSGTQVRLDVSPDIRLWRSQLAAAPAAAFLPVGSRSDEYDIWLLQSALRAGGEDVPTDGQWSPAIAAALARRTAALTPPLPPHPTPQQVWDLLWAGNRLPFEHDPPDHADLVAHLRERPDRWPKGTPASCMADNGVVRIDITVRSRHWRPLATNRVLVTLLRVRFGRHANLAAIPRLPAGWAAALTADRSAAPGAAGGWLAGSDWVYVDPAHPFRSPGTTLDPDNPQVVSFEADLAGVAWAKRGWLLLAVVVADDDPLNTAETDVARLLATDRHMAARSVRRTHALVTAQSRQAGMDTANYPGLAPMDRAWERSNLTWTGLYLDSPMPVPGEAPVPAGVHAGHNRLGGTPGHPAGSWMRAWSELWPDWGIAPIYWGQQDPNNPQGPFDLRGFVAVGNAEDAAAKAAAAGIPSGAVIYLDWEIGGTPAANGLAYCQRFWHRLAELGYRPGVYAHPPGSRAFRREVPGVFAWNANCLNGHCNPVAGDVRTVHGQDVLSTPDLNAAIGRPDPDALARQWRFNLPLPNLGPLQPFPQIDADVAIVADPAFPERRPQPADVRGGGASALPGTADPLVVYAVRRGGPRRSTWRAGAAIADAALAATVFPNLWNPFCPITAVRVPGAPDPTDYLLALGCDAHPLASVWPLQADISDPAWRVQALERGPGGRWRVTTVPDGGLVIDPLGGVAAVVRAPDTIEVVVIDDVSGLPATARWSPTSRRWSPLVFLTAAGAHAARRTNRPAAVWRGPNDMDVLWVGGDGRPRAARSTAPGNWAAPALVGDPQVEVHPLGNLVAVSPAPDRIDVLFIGRRTGAPDWSLYDTWWTAVDGWTPAHTQILGGTALLLEPMARIAAHSRAPGMLDAFAVAATGALVTTGSAAPGGPWTPLAAVGGQPLVGAEPAAPGLAAVPAQPLRLASVDGSCSRNADELTVLATGRDGNAYATRWDRTSGAYTMFENIIPLALA